MMTGSMVQKKWHMHRDKQWEPAKWPFKWKCVTRHFFLQVRAGPNVWPDTFGTESEVRFGLAIQLLLSVTVVIINVNVHLIWAI